MFRSRAPVVAVVIAQPWKLAIKLHTKCIHKVNSKIGKKFGIFFMKNVDNGFLREIDFIKICVKIVHFFKSNKTIVQKIYFLGLLHIQLLDHPKAKYNTNA